MKVQKAKDLLRQLICSRGWDINDMHLNYQALINASQSLHKSETCVYRVLKIVDGDVEKIKPHTISSTSSELSSVIDIQDSMPSILFSEQGMVNFESHYMRFNIPNSKILLDIDKVVLPAIKKKLEKVSNHQIEGKTGEMIKISKAIELYEKSKEREIICDLTGVTPASSVTIGSSVNGKYQTSKLRAFCDKNPHSIHHIMSELNNEYISNQEITELAQKILSPRDFSSSLASLVSNKILKISEDKKEMETGYSPQ